MEEVERKIELVWMTLNSILRSDLRKDLVRRNAVT